MRITLANADDYKKLVYVLNETALDLHNKGIKQWEYPWNENEILNQIKSSYLYTVSVDERIIGTFGIKNIDSLSVCEIQPNSQYLYQLAILPEYQGNGYGRAIIEWACGYVREKDKALYLDCWSGNGNLKSFYQENGFHYEGDFPEEDYYISVFKMN
ncbi:GNAT family N-acetyltransferase [Heyndrickxia sp. MSNUG]|uniref:GNAT family N-acetyltransferase n=1 Tax=Heyndrickxia sp. MSNUG TaxID=3136677 RepID=UPI003C2DEC30